jgi:acylphosphatase
MHMADSTGLERLHAFVHGRVQGVGFRAFVLHEASALDLNGWCRNVGWNQVEVVAEGSKANLEGLLAELRRGPSMSAVEKVISEWTQGTGEFTQFRVR